MVSITSLTDEQKARFAEYRERFKKAGLSTEPANRKEAEIGINLCYTLRGLSEPKEIVWCDGPKDFVNKIASRTNQTPKQVWDSRNWVYGQHDAAYYGWVAFYGEVVGLEKPAQAAGLIKVAENAGWFAPYENVCFVMERPETLKRNESNRLHCADGPAMRYRDGFELYRHNGTRIPATHHYIITNPEQITVEKIDNEDNLELKRIMIERFGLKRYNQEGGAEKISEDEYGSAYSKAIKGQSKKLTTVQVIDGTNKDEVFVIEVDPDGRPLREGSSLGGPQEMTAKNLVASTFGKRGEQYHPLIET